MAQGIHHFALGNPRLPCPGKIEPYPPAELDTKAHAMIEGAQLHKNRSRKRLVVLCDGTGQDSFGVKAQNPSNVVRIARALSPNAWEELPHKPGYYEEIEQIVYYEAGVGTFEGNAFLGGIFGTGLSEIVRAAYGFLAHNYAHGDKICVFGFSRGAYIARAIAGLVAERGLLNKRSMDNFLLVYKTFYDEQSNDTNDHSKREITRKRDQELGLMPVPRGTVKVVGVFDTVGFHNPITAWLNNGLRKLKISDNFFDSNDRDEFKNTELSLNVKYAFHAMSLDESRTPFQTTLWFQKKKEYLHGHEINPVDLGGDDDGKWDTTLKQVWFSGVHSDVGGGMQDPYLSNISLGWMISQLVENDILAFDQNYLLGEDIKDPAAGVPKKYIGQWDTWKGGKKNEYQYTGFFAYIRHLAGAGGLKLVEGLKTIAVFVLRYICFSPRRSLWLSGNRTPGRYVPVVDSKKVTNKDDYDTNEEIHCSVTNRDFNEWPCAPLQNFTRPLPTESSELSTWDFNRKTGVWSISKDVPSYVINQNKPSAIENFFKGRMRFTLERKPGEHRQVLPHQERGTQARPVERHEEPHTANCRVCRESNSGESSVAINP